MKVSRPASARIVIELAPGQAPAGFMSRADQIAREAVHRLDLYTGETWQRPYATYGHRDTVQVVFGTFWNCGFCGKEWHEDYEGVPTCCARARAEWVAEQLEGNQGP